MKLALLYLTHLSIVTLIIVLGCVSAFAQDSTFNRFNDESDRLQRTSMGMLTGITAASMLSTGTFIYYDRVHAPDDQTLQVYQGVNLGINTVTFALSLFGGPEPGRNLSAYESLQRSNRLVNVYAFSLGLDFVYTATALHVLDNAQRAPNGFHERFEKGYAFSVLGQGVLFMVYDGLMLLAHKRNQKRHNHLFSNLKPASSGIGLSYRF